MAKFKVTLAKAATYTEMATGKTWKRGQSETMDEAKAAKYKANPRFVVNEVGPPKAKAKAPKAAPKADDGGDGGDDGDNKTKVPPKKKAPKKKAGG